MSEHWGCWLGHSYSSISQNGPGPSDPRIHSPEYIAGLGGRAPGVSLLGNIGLDCGWVAEISCGLKEIYF